MISSSKGDIKMKKFKLLLTSTILLFITACGTTDAENEIDENKGFDMWEYMTSPLNYEVEYTVYKDSVETDYYIETNKVFDNGDTYERRSATARTTLYLNTSYILMKEPARDVEINRYVHLGDNNVFKSSDIDNCIVERFYPKYTVHDSTFENVLMINCLSKSGVKQEFYYGYSEGIVAIYQNDNSVINEYVKVKEKRIF